MIILYRFRGAQESAGHFAVLVAVEGDPLADVNVTISNVKWVMKACAVVVEKH